MASDAEADAFLAALRKTGHRVESGKVSGLVFVEIPRGRLDVPIPRGLKIVSLFPSDWVVITNLRRP